MKNITKQYQDLLEGKMSKDTFMRNVRREFPQWVSPVNSFQDAVTILKSKRILHEADLTGRGRIGGETAQNSEVSMIDRSLLNPHTAAEKVAEKNPLLTAKDQNQLRFPRAK